MSKQPEISIITVCKNSAGTIEESIQSVLNQEYSNLEYIIIDGGSTDDTLSIIEKYSKEISVVISEKDNGIYDAMNKGIKLSTGEIIGILNSDDQYFSHTLATIAENYNSNNIIVGYCLSLNEDKEQLQTISGKRFQKKKSIDRLKDCMAIDHTAMFVPRQIYLDQGLYDINKKISADYKWTANAWKNGTTFDLIDKPITIFSSGGVSYHRWIQSAIENRDIQLELGLLRPFSANMLMFYRIFSRFITRGFIGAIKRQLNLGLYDPLK